MIKNTANERAQCQRWPLMIDPQLQGIRWLRRHEEVATEASGRSLHVLQMGEVRRYARLTYLATLTWGFRQSTLFFLCC